MLRLLNVVCCQTYKSFFYQRKSKRSQRSIIFPNLNVFEHQAYSRLYMRNFPREIKKKCQITPFWLQKEKYLWKSNMSAITYKLSLQILIWSQSNKIKRNLLYVLAILILLTFCSYFLCQPIWHINKICCLRIILFHSLQIQTQLEIKIYKELFLWRSYDNQEMNLIKTDNKLIRVN